MARNTLTMRLWWGDDPAHFTRCLLPQGGFHANAFCPVKLIANKVKASRVSRKAGDLRIVLLLGIKTGLTVA
jgi:hypothetical protein